MAVNNDFLPYAESFYETTLAQAMTAATTTMVVTTAPSNSTGYLVIEPKSSNREIVRYTSASGTTLTVVRGLSETSNVDDSSGTGKAHAAGVEVAMKDVHYYFNKIIAAFRGANSTGFNNITIGDGNTISASRRVMYFSTSSLSAYIGLNTAGRFVVSEDGTTEYVVSAGGSGVTAGSAINITAGVLTVDLLSTGGLFKSSAAKLAVALSTGLNRDTGGLYVDQSSAFYWTGLHNFTDISIDSTQISATAAEINELIGVTNKVSSLTENLDASELHYHTNTIGLSPNTSDLTYQLQYGQYWDNWTYWVGASMAMSCQGGFTTFVGATNGYLMTNNLPGTENTSYNAQVYSEVGKIGFKVRAQKADTSPSYFGFGCQTSDYTTANVSGTFIGVQFAISGASYAVYARTGDNTGTTSATVLTSGGNLWHTYAVEYTGNSQAVFYVDGLSAASITTKLPFAPSGVQFGIGAYDASTVKITPPIIMLKQL